MNRKGILSALAFMFFVSFTSGQSKIIFDTDFGSDIDDLGALAMLHNFHYRGECELLGITSWSNKQYVIPAMDAMNRFFNNPDIPMGVRQNIIPIIHNKL